MGVVRGWGKAEGRGKGCGREASRNEEMVSGTTVLEQGPACAASSGVGGMELGKGSWGWDGSWEGRRVVASAWSWSWSKTWVRGLGSVMANVDCDVCRPPRRSAVQSRYLSWAGGRDRRTETWLEDLAARNQTA